MGQIYEQTGEYKKAIAVYERLLAKKADLWVGVNNLAFLLADHGATKAELQRALTLAKSAYTVYPEDPGVLDTVGWASYKNGDLKSASDFIGRAYTKAPDSPVINYHWGLLLHKQGKTADAKAKFKKAANAKEAFYGKDEARRLSGNFK